MSFSGSLHLAIQRGAWKRGKRKDRGKDWEWLLEELGEKEGGLDYDESNGGGERQSILYIFEVRINRICSQIKHGV